MKGNWSASSCRKQTEQLSYQTRPELVKEQPETENRKTLEVVAKPVQQACRIPSETSKAQNSTTVGVAAYRRQNLDLVETDDVCSCQNRGLVCSHEGHISGALHHSQHLCLLIMQELHLYSSHGGSCALLKRDPKVLHVPCTCQQWHKQRQGTVLGGEGLQVTRDRTPPTNRQGTIK